MTGLTLLQRSEIRDAHREAMRAALGARDLDFFAHALGVATDLAFRMGVEAAHANSTAEWAIRCANEGHPDAGQIFKTGKEDGLRTYAARADNCYQLISRRNGPWEVASDV